jgi:transketolase
MTPGIEVSTGPLGQGISNAVGMALAQNHLAATFNKTDFPLFDNYTYVFCGDGCMQEGISSEACSLAGHLGLNKLIVMYDDNKITIDGETHLSFTEDVPKRFQAYGWNTITVQHGDTDLAGIEAAIREAKKSTDKPTLISIKTTIGFGSGKQGTEGVHGAALGAADIVTVKTKFGFDPKESFVVAKEVTEMYSKFKPRGEDLKKAWDALLHGYCEKYPKEGKELTRRMARELPENWKSLLPKFNKDAKPIATRVLSGNVLNALAPTMSELIGGSADLTPSTKTDLKCSGDYQKKTPTGRYIRFGVREHAMAAMGNGIAAYGCLIPYTATFLNFIEYCFPSVRLSAISEVQQIYVMTHDSIGLGEDGPTHQPIEALTLCRSTPNVTVIRPCDVNETSGAYACALENKHGPTVLALSRQDLPHLAGTSIDAVAKGGYIVQESESKDKPDVIFVATGSEVHLACNAADKLKGTKNVRVVSMPSTSHFDKQSVEYRRSVITPGVLVISIECLASRGWEKYSHFQIGMTTYGASAPLKAVMDKFGFTTEKVVARTTALLAQNAKDAATMGVSPIGPLLTHYQL